VFNKWIPLDFIIKLLDVEAGIVIDQAIIVKEVIKTLQIVFEACNYELNNQSEKTADLLNIVITRGLI
jgi:hypothetical protein